MNGRFITWVIIGVSFGFTQLWFAYWVVKLFKEKQRIMKVRRAAGQGTPPPPQAEPAPGTSAAAEDPAPDGKG
jgi:hypothetical protein